MSHVDYRQSPENLKHKFELITLIDLHFHDLIYNNFENPNEINPCEMLDPEWFKYFVVPDKTKMQEFILTAIEDYLRAARDIYHVGWDGFTNGDFIYNFVIGDGYKQHRIKKYFQLTIQNTYHKDNLGRYIHEVYLNEISFEVDSGFTRFLYPDIRELPAELNFKPIRFVIGEIDPDNVRFELFDVPSLNECILKHYHPIFSY